MKLINEKYRQLKPTIDYLCDEIVIAQAWKKSHAYIRHHNWYADTLELDVSALGIEEYAPAWAEQLRDLDKPHLMELVPAAKSEAWVLDEDGWHPTKESEGSRKGQKGLSPRAPKIPLRPLAQIHIRDQTWASAVMLCLADCVESAQGDCSHGAGGAESVLRRKVYSYGNRLLCEWRSPNQAWFRWGNSETYKKFFSDYQNFLRRPIDIGRNIVLEQASDESVFVVNLDLAKFYNTIDRKLLIHRLQDLCRNETDEICTDFWSATDSVMSWLWAPESLCVADQLQLGDIENGLPQGMVASGFFANAYLINFDRAIGEAIGTALDGLDQLVLHDYCRYVDDLRLVVSSEHYSVSEIESEINKWVAKPLKKYGGESLAINPSKTKVIPLAELDNRGSLSKRVEMVQNELSGPADREMLDSATGILESLLMTEDSIRPEMAKNGDQLLLEVTGFDHDIRPDTLKRFAANRLQSIVRSKRQLVTSSVGEDCAGADAMENENELLAKKLVQAWMRDPSLALVLRKAIEIYPSAELFEPVFDGIVRRSSIGIEYPEPAVDKTTQAIMDYLLADLFRCAADFNGYFQVIEYPNNLKPFSVVNSIARIAHQSVASKKSPWFVHQQALMLLAVLNKPIATPSEKLRLQSRLHRILLGSPSLEFAEEDGALYEIAAQISGDFDTYAADFLRQLSGSSCDSYSELEVSAKRGGPFWFALWKRLK